MRATGYRFGVLAIVSLMALSACAGGASSGRPSGTSPDTMLVPTNSAGPTGDRSPSRAPSASPTDRAGASPLASLSAEAAVRIALSGRGPLGMAIEGSVGWVVATDSGDLIELDLGAGREVGSTRIGSAGQQVVLGGEDEIFVGRYDARDTGNGLLRVSGPRRTVTGIATAAIGGLTEGERGTIWGLEKSGRVIHVQPGTGRILAKVSIAVDTNEHMDLVAGAGARWASSDHTALRRIAADGTVVAEIDTGGGIPLTTADGLIWGARADEIWAVDPATNTVSRHVPIVDVDEILAMDVRDGEAWVAVRRPGRIGRVLDVDLATGAVTAEYAVSLPAAVELTAERAWVTDYESDEVLGFDR